MGEVEVGAAAPAVYLFDGGYLHAVPLFFAHLSYHDVAVEADDGAFEAFAAYQHLGLVPLRGEVLDVPDVVFLDEAELFGGGKETFYHHVAGAF